MLEYTHNALLSLLACSLLHIEAFPIEASIGCHTRKIVAKHFLPLNGTWSLLNSRTYKIETGQKHPWVRHSSIGGRYRGRVIDST
jgi:hypothetical protein